jgi:hypothetical protein
VVREYAPRGVAGRSAWQVQDEVVILGHCLLLCSSGRGNQAVSGNKPRAVGALAGNSLDGVDG